MKRIEIAIQEFSEKESGEGYNWWWVWSLGKTMLEWTTFLCDFAMWLSSMF